MNPPSHGELGDNVDRYMQEILQSEIDLNDTYAEQLSEMNATVDEVLLAMTSIGAPITNLQDIRRQLGETSGLLKTHDALHRLINSSDSPAKSEPDIGYHTLVHSYGYTYMAMDLAAKLGIHRMAPSTYSQREVEACIIADGYISPSDKTVLLQTVGILWQSEGLNSNDPDAYIYIDDTIKRLAAEDAAVLRSRANIESLKLVFADLQREYHIADHDDLPRIVSMLAHGLGTISIIPEKQAAFRSLVLASARRHAVELGWSDKLFNAVVTQLKDVELS